jgi:hypothetical protein
MILEKFGGRYVPDFGFDNSLSVLSQPSSPYQFIAGLQENTTMTNGIKFLKAQKWLRAEYENLSKS